MELGAVAEHQGDGVAALQAQPGEPAGERVDALAQLSPRPCDLVALGPDRDVVGPVGGRDAKGLGDGGGSHRAARLRDLLHGPNYRWYATEGSARQASKAGRRAPPLLRGLAQPAVVARVGVEEVLRHERHAGALGAAEPLEGRGQQLALLGALGRRVGDAQAPRDRAQRHAALGDAGSAGRRRRPPASRPSARRGAAGRRPCDSWRRRRRRSCGASTRSAGRRRTRGRRGRRGADR